ncbi:MAG: prephenate dehydrogenase/arogenate dehydrogenase family protein, partial [Clostridia bacterium]|nr:prephenate dehydrogenase/arogenate dehydrogenase family protein [Clostridia bacterium]
PEIAKENGFIFIGGHPMAGIEKIGFKYSNAEIFADASMILTPDDSVKIEDLANIKIFFLSIGFGKITVKTAKDHDRIIAYTSQLAHVLSNAYVKSETAKEHKGLSAGSFMDLTRVAYLNETMWTELFMENRNNLINEISTLIDNLSKYKIALEEDNADELKELLKNGRELKEALNNE